MQRRNRPNLEKRPPFFQFSSKLSYFFFVERFEKSSSFSFVSFWKHTFLLGWDVWKMDNLFQLPLEHISIILNFPKKGWNQTAFLPKNWEVLIKIEGIQVISAPNGQNLTPCPRYLRVKTFDKTAKTENWLELEIAKLLNCQNWKLTRCQNWKLLSC